ncbi:MAG: cytochrome Cbb3 oxidase maturation protein CcoH [Saprospiraceae bacterium]|nr:MAG: cytochrome Cbb3 oxidase maturation protein CcoH [Saprospiraceae bacterium]
MKFNWGTGIFLFYSIFAASLFYQVYKSTLYDNSLVVDNYYEKDLAYQSMFEKKENSMRLEDGLKISYHPDIQTVSLNFPKNQHGVMGKVLFYRANDKSQDITLDIQTNTINEMILPVEALTYGQWKIEVDWQSGGKPYFDEKVITIIAQNTKTNNS